MVLLIAFDLETSGLDPQRHEAIEIAARVINEGTKAFFAARLKIERDPQPGTLGVYNHYDPNLWARSSLPQEEGWRQFAEWVKKQQAHWNATKVMLVGASVGTFDLQFVRAMLPRVPELKVVERHTIDLSSVYAAYCLSRGIEIESVGLEAICERLGVRNVKPHDAYSDVMATVEAFKVLMQRMTP